jgi:hypothetical protein
LPSNKWFGNERRNENEKVSLAIVTLMIAAFPIIGKATENTSLIVSLDDDGNLACSVSSFRGLDSFSNKEENIKVVNRRPATKSGYVHMWLTFENGDLLFLNDVNGRVAKLLNGNAAEWARNWLLAKPHHNRPKREQNLH